MRMLDLDDDLSIPHHGHMDLSNRGTGQGFLFKVGELIHQPFGQETFHLVPWCGRSLVLEFRQFSNVRDGNKIGPT